MALVVISLARSSFLPSGFPFVVFFLDIREFWRVAFTLFLLIFLHVTGIRHMANFSSPGIVSKDDNYIFHLYIFNPHPILKGLPRLTY